MSDQKVKTVKSGVLKSALAMKGLMDDYYLEASRARADKIPLAWTTSLFPVELLYAMGVFPYYPENYGAKCGAKKLAQPFFRESLRSGYSQDLCSYMRITAGATSGNWPLDEEPFELSSDHKSPPRGRIESLPIPDLMITSSNQCDTLNKLFESKAREWDIPFFVLDCPFYDGGMEEWQIRYFLEELYELVSFIEFHTGNRFSQEKLAEVLDLSNQACTLWNDVLRMGAHKPAVFTVWDANVFMNPMVNLRGTQMAVEFYGKLKTELVERKDKGVYPVPDEEYRLLWNGIPLWHRLRFFSEYFAKNRASVVISPYVLAWAYTFDVSRPMESLAESYSGILINRNIDERLNDLIGLIAEYGVDGFIFYSNRSCKADSFGFYELKKMINEKTGLPGVIFEGDICDDNFFSEEAFLEQMDVFMGMVGRSKSNA